MTAPVFDPDFQTQFETLLRWRRDVRAFRRDPLPPGLLDELLRLTRLAPSVGYSQPWRWVIVETPEARAAVRANFTRCNAEALAAQGAERASLYAKLKLAGLDDAPVQLACFALTDPEAGHGLGRRTMPETLAYSAVTAIHTLWLAARMHGIGLGWVSILDAAAVGDTLAVPPDWRFIAYLCLGYPETDSARPTLEQAGWQARLDDDGLVLTR
ncbi:5,6-dimethylbenzimidazole synthase [Elstera cyanobacteriorum]|uniref:5,6-dimethylbenzimidazole synthase n=1 Tax=Elstera cyanobacteriorum TaxID=2022747 RepID=A0A255XRU9_9PROT|nr:5,6-dimethylbenzimidazole synthase [Elstera cyanobacteriorum]OYQ19726.1 5,6-dimethylbenzimidazole synthase [Elstera cyanobacteriorum]GFZ95248.1 5,6-dimethylbenzimidazole synthase [Elstera cyanobacteriorum]